MNRRETAKRASPPRSSSRPAPPSFEEATSLRQKAFAAGFDPAYWYAVEFEENVRPGQVVEVKFQGMSIALYRGEDGTFGAVEDRCAHRHVKLSKGKVRGCELTCSYHGWSYDAEGNLTSAPPHFDDKPLPKARLAGYPVAVKYGLVFVFFGDPALAASRPLPTIDILEGDDPWVCIPIDFTMACHPTAYINNVMDSTHVAALHRKFRTRSMDYGPITRCEAEGDSVVISHTVELDQGGLFRHLMKAFRNPTQDAWYDYPYLHVQVGGVAQLWNFMLPIDERTTRIFLLSCSDRATIPFTTWKPPDVLIKPFFGVLRELLVRPLFEEDVWSTEAEQEAYEAFHDVPTLDPHPSIRPCYQLTIRKWEEHLARESRGADPRALTVVDDSSVGGGR